MSKKMTVSTGPIAIPTVAKTEISLGSSSPIAESVWVHRIDVLNSANASIALGWGYKLIDSEWKAGQWDESAGASYIDDTTDAQDAGTGDFDLFSANNNNDGFIVQADTTFNIIGISCNTAPASGQSIGYQYWNGSAWTTLNTIVTPTFANATDTYLVFHAPNDWAALLAADTPVATDGLTAGKYAIKVRASTAPNTTSGSADKLWVVKFKDYIEAVADGSTAFSEYENGEYIPHNRPIVPYFATADNNNTVSIVYRKTA